MKSNLVASIINSSIEAGKGCQSCWQRDYLFVDMITHMSPKAYEELRRGATGVEEWEERGARPARSSCVAYQGDYPVDL